MPNPNPNETEGDYMNRCMSDEEMKRKHPDQDERYAVCQSFWDNRSIGKDEKD